MAQKGILAFSGGLDTSVVVKYLQAEHDMDVITVTVDVGQGDDHKKIAAKAKKLGVKKHYNIDARKEFVKDYIFPSIKANALYQKKYCLATALARPLIAEKVLDVAKKEKVTSLAHGCSGKGNDQVRFDTLTNMCFNLGAPRLSGFKKMWEAIEAGDYSTAAEEMLDSKWARQVGPRADRLAQKMETGIDPS